MFKNMKILAVAILIAGSIELVVGISDQIDPNTKSALNIPENLEKVKDVVNLALTDPKTAAKHAQQYLQTDLPKGVKSLIEKATKTPEEVQTLIEPWVTQAYNQLPKLNENGLLYRAAVQPSWNFVTGLGSLLQKGVGQTIQGAVGASKIALDSVRESTDAIGERLGYPTKRVDGAFERIDSGMKRIQGVGSSWENDGAKRVQGIDGRRSFRKRQKSFDGSN